MKKYLFIFKSELMTNIQYITNVFSSFIGYFIIMFIFLNLWKYIYSNPTEVINGYTMNQMIWYVLVTEALWSITDGTKLCRKINEDVKSGNVAYNINKPYSYIGYILMSHLGSVVLKTIFLTFFALLLGYLFLGTFPSLNLFSALGVLITFVLAIIINCLLTQSIALFSFSIEDATPFYWLYSKFILIVGTTFPIEYFPKIIQPLLNLSPIYAAVYGPAKLFVKFSLNTFLNVILMQIIYLILSYGLCTLLYKKGVKKLNVNGG